MSKQVTFDYSKASSFITEHEVSYMKKQALDANDVNLCLVGTYEQGKIDSIKTGDLLTGITGKLDLSDSKKAPQLSIPNSILVVDSGKTIEPIEVTMSGITTMVKLSQ